MKLFLSKHFHITVNFILNSNNVEITRKKKRGA